LLRLTFPAHVIGAFIIAFTLINISIVRWYGPPETITVKLTGEERLIRTDFIQNSTHIKGSHIVHILPYSIAKLNPNGTHYCISSNQPSVEIPILIKGNPPWKIDYEIIQSDGTKESFLNESVKLLDPQGRKIRDVDAGRVNLLSLTATKPGLYVLKGIRGGRNIEGKVINTSVIVTSCPHAHWHYHSDKEYFLLHEKSKEVHKPRFQRCIDESFSEMDLFVYGVPPLRVWYLKRVRETESLVSVDDIQEESIEADSLSKPNLNNSSWDNSLLAPPQSQEVRIPLNITVDIDGPYFFKIVRVTDAFNNTVVYESTLVPVGATTGFQTKASESGDSFLLEAHSRPTARFHKCDTVKLKPQEKKSALLPIHFTGNLPWNVIVLYHGPNNRRIEFNQIASSEFGIPIDKSGLYTLESVSDSICTGEVVAPYSCVVQETKSPILEIAAEPIEQSCVGTVGALVNLTLSGEPPFWIQYSQTFVESGRTSTDRIVIHKPRHSLSLLPNMPGKYIYEFNKVYRLNLILSPLFLSFFLSFFLFFPQFL